MTFSALDSMLVGPLFATDAMRGCFSDASRVRAMLAVEIALARAEEELAIVPPGLAEAIARLDPQAIDAASIGRGAALAGVPTIPFVKAVQAQLPPEFERSFHKGATTQDVLDTALVLQCRDAISLIASELVAILDGLASMAVRERDTACVGRSYGQHAAPITFGYKAAVWLAGVASVGTRLAAVRTDLLVASLGGPVGTLAAMGGKGPAVLEGFARQLGLRAPPIAWHVRRSSMAGAGCWLAEVIGALAKIATDVADLSSTEVAEVAEPHVPGRGGSTSMPHKRNPVSCTVILAAHAAAPGHAAALIGAMAAAHERPAGLWHAEWHALPTLFGLVSGALREARVLAEGLQLNRARMRQNLEMTRGLLFAEAAAATLANTLGRDIAHDLVESAASEVLLGGKTLLEVLLKLTAVSGTDLELAFDLAPAVSAANSWIARAVAFALEVRASLAAP